VVNNKTSSRVCCGTTTYNPFTQLCCNEQAGVRSVVVMSCAVEALHITPEMKLAVVSAAEMFAD